MNHRDPKLIKMINHVGHNEDINSLCILMPNNLLLDFNEKLDD